MESFQQVEFPVCVMGVRSIPKQKEEVRMFPTEKRSLRKTVGTSHSLSPQD